MIVRSALITAGVLLSVAHVKAQTLDWVAVAASSGNNQGHAIVAADGVLSGGWAQSQISLNPGGTVLLAGYSNYVYKLSQDREFLWLARVEGSNSLGVITTDAQHNAYLSGELNGISTHATSGTGQIVPIVAGDARGVFIWKLDENGSSQWMRALTRVGSGSANAYGIGVMLDGTVIVTGRFSGSLDTDPGESETILTGRGDEDIFLVALSANGEFLWSYQAGGPDNDRPSSLAVGDSSIAVGGHFSGTIALGNDLNPVNLQSAGGRDGLVLRLDHAGNLVWHGGIGGAGDDRIVDVALDAHDNLGLTGTFTNTADLAPGPETELAISEGASDVFATLLDADNTRQWSRWTGSSDIDEANAIAFGSGHVYVGGSFSGTVAFDQTGGEPAVSALGASDGYVWRLGRDGGFSSLITIGGDNPLPYSDRVNGFAIAPDGGLLATGGYTGAADFDPAPETAFVIANGTQFADAFTWKLHDLGALVTHMDAAMLTLPVGASTRLTLTLTSSLDTSLTNLGVEQHLPEAFHIAAEAQIETDCSGVASATPGGTEFTLDGATLPAGTSCTLSVNAQAVSAGIAMFTSRPSDFRNNENIWPLTTSTAEVEATRAIPLLELQTHEPDPSMSGELVEFGIQLQSAAPGAPSPSGQATVSSDASTCTFQLFETSCWIALTTLGTHDVTIAYSGDSNYEPASITFPHRVFAFSNLAVAFSGYPESVQGGSELEFDLLISNVGPDDAQDSIAVAEVTGMSGTEWACTQGCSAAGAGNVNAHLSLVAGETTVIRVHGSVLALPEGILGATATVSAIEPAYDDSMIDNTASASASVVLFRNGFDGKKATSSHHD